MSFDFLRSYHPCLHEIYHPEEYSQRIFLRLPDGNRKYPATEKRLEIWKGGNKMAEKGKSKTDVSARAGNKSKAQCCSNCGNKVEVVLSVTPDGKKKMRRICCVS